MFSNTPSQYRSTRACRHVKRAYVRYDVANNFDSTDSVIDTMLANLTTVQKWPKELESVGEWLRWDESGGKVSRIFCALCAKHVDRLQEMRNYSLLSSTGSPEVP